MMSVLGRKKSSFSVVRN